MQSHSTEQQASSRGLLLVAASQLNCILSTSANAKLLRKQAVFTYNGQQYDLMRSSCIQLTALSKAVGTGLLNASVFEALIDGYGTHDHLATLMKWLMQRADKLTLKLLQPESDSDIYCRVWYLCLKCLELLCSPINDLPKHARVHYSLLMAQQLESHGVLRGWSAILEQLLQPPPPTQQQLLLAGQQQQQQQAVAVQPQPDRCEDALGRPAFLQLMRCWSTFYAFVTWAEEDWPNSPELCEFLVHHSQSVLQQVQRCIELLPPDSPTPLAGASAAAAASDQAAAQFGRESSDGSTSDCSSSSSSSSTKPTADAQETSRNASSRGQHEAAAWVLVLFQEMILTAISLLVGQTSALQQLRQQHMARDELLAVHELVGGDDVAAAVQQQLAAYCCIMHLSLQVSAQNAVATQTGSPQQRQQAWKQQQSVKAIPSCSRKLLSRLVPHARGYFTALGLWRTCAHMGEDHKAAVEKWFSRQPPPALALSAMLVQSIFPAMMACITAQRSRRSAAARDSPGNSTSSSSSVQQRPALLTGTALQLLIELQCLLAAAVSQQLHQAPFHQHQHEQDAATAAGPVPSAAASTHQQQQRQEQNGAGHAQQRSRHHQQGLHAACLQDSDLATDPQLYQLLLGLLGAPPPNQHQFLTQHPVSQAALAVFRCNELLVHLIAAIAHNPVPDGELYKKFQLLFAGHGSKAHFLHALAAPVQMVQLSQGQHEDVVQRMSEYWFYNPMGMQQQLLAVAALGSGDACSSGDTTGFDLLLRDFAEKHTPLAVVSCNHPEAYLGLVECCLRAPKLVASDTLLAAALLTPAVHWTSVPAASLVSAVTSLAKRLAQMIRAAGARQASSSSSSSSSSSIGQPISAHFSGCDHVHSAEHFPAAVPLIQRVLWTVARAVFRPSSRSSSHNGGASSSSSSSNGGQCIPAATAALIRVVLSRFLVVLADAMEAAAAAAAASITPAQLFARSVMAKPCFLTQWKEGYAPHDSEFVSVGAFGNRQDFTTAGQWRIWQLSFLRVFCELHCSSTAADMCSCAEASPPAAAAAATSDVCSDSSPSGSGEARNTPAVSSGGGGSGCEGQSVPSKWGYLLALPAAVWSLAAAVADQCKRFGLDAADDTSSSCSTPAAAGAVAGSTAAAGKMAGDQLAQCSAADVSALYERAIGSCRALVAAAPLPLVCNNPACENLSGVSEASIAVKMCAGCHCRYCSAACQTADWKRHRKACKRMAAAGQVCK